MDQCPYCGGYLGGAIACPACGAPVQQAQYAQTSYTQQGQQYSQQYPQYAQQQVQYAQQPDGQYDRTQVYAPQQNYAGQAYDGGQSGAAYDGYRSEYAADPSTVAWHLSQEQAAAYAGFQETAAAGATVPDASADLAGLAGAMDAIGPDEPPDLPWETEPGADAPQAGELHAGEPEYAGEEDCEPDHCEGRGRSRGRRGKSRHRTLKLVVGTATGFVLAGALMTVLPNELLPTSHSSAQDSTPQADGESADSPGSSGTPSNAVPITEQDPSTASGAGGHSTGPASSASAKATHHPAATHSATPTRPPATRAPSSGPTQAPPATSTPPPQHTQSPPPGCVLLCWD
jgi:hypothetical protein